MLTDEIIDEDIEALLYAQIYHGKPDHAEVTQQAPAAGCTPPEELRIVAGLEEQGRNEPLEEPSQIEQPDLTAVPIPSTIQEPSSTIHLSSTDSPSVNIRSSQNEDHNGSEVIIQQISPSKQFWSRLKRFKNIWSCQCAADLKRFEAGKLTEKRFFRKLNNRARNRLLKQLAKKKKQEQIRSHIHRQQQRLACSEVISLLSDSESSDVEIVVMDEAGERPRVPGNPPEAQPEDDDDDDIVYVEPPPVPCINLEDDDEDEEPEHAPQEKPSQDYEDCSNDFLVPAPSSEQFNFSLHGSDFQDVEFARPAQPTDTYETESSASTSELPKDFNNTVKTIVFNEIDFPREEDLFQEGNLDKFGEMIGPTSAEVVDRQSADKVTKATGQSHSSSSSESDYGAAGLHQNLPYLSPMQTAKRPTLAKKHEEEDLEAAPATPTRKAKKRSSMPCENATEDSAKKAKKKKKKSAAKELEDTHAHERSQVLPPAKKDNCDPPKKGKKKKKQPKNDSLAPVAAGPEPGLLVNSEDIVKKKSKKRRESVANLDCGSASDLNELDDGRKRKNPKKQKISLGGKPEEPSEMSDNSEPETGKIVDKDTSYVEHDEGRAAEEEVIDIINVNAATLDAEDSQRLDESDDVILVEKDIPIHTIDSSNSDSESDYLECGLELPMTEELHLANVRAITDKLPEIMNDPKYDIEYIQSKMTDDPEKWKVLPVDQQVIRVESGGPRCRRCRERGHISKYCQSKSSIPNCSLCGFQGHQEPRCPNKICLNCGKRNNFTTTSCLKCSNQKTYGICHVCKLPGHVGNNCPDLWRRYYLTSKVGSIVKPEKPVVLPREERWCSGCSANGHLEFECSSFKWIREYPATTPYICSYKDVYKSESQSIGNHANREVAAQPVNPPIGPEHVQAGVNANAASPKNKSPIFTKDLRREGKPRVNPVSVHAHTAQYTRYESVLNPCSVLATSSPSNADHEASMSRAPYGIDVNTLPQLMEREVPMPVFNAIPVRTSFGLMNQHFEGTTLNYAASGLPKPYSYEVDMQPLPGPTISFLEDSPQSYSNCSDFTMDDRYFEHPTLNSSNSSDFGQSSQLFEHNQPTTGRYFGTSPTLVDSFKRLYNVEEAAAEVFGCSPIGVLKNFIDTELRKLGKTNVLPVTTYRNMLLNIAELKSGLQNDSVRSQVFELYKSLNMFVFGVHKMNHGTRNLSFLRNFVCNAGRFLQDKKRIELVKAYEYVFGGEHLNFNYIKCLDSIEYRQGGDKQKHYFWKA